MLWRCTHASHRPTASIQIIDPKSVPHGALEEAEDDDSDTDEQDIMAAFLGGRAMPAFGMEEDLADRVRRGLCCCDLPVVFMSCALVCRVQPTASRCGRVRLRLVLLLPPHPPWVAAGAHSAPRSLERMPLCGARGPRWSVLFWHVVFVHKNVWGAGWSGLEVSHTRAYVCAGTCVSEPVCVWL